MGFNSGFKGLKKKWIFFIGIQFTVLCSGNRTVPLNSHVLSKSSVMLSSAVKFPVVMSKKREMLHQPKLM